MKLLTTLFARLVATIAMVAVVAPLGTSALTEDELRQQILDLLSQISRLGAQVDAAGVGLPPDANANVYAPSTSYAGASTRDVLNGGLTLSGYLERGMRGADVTRLQQFLALDSLIYPEAQITGFFGPLTERAVERFQVACGIVSAGDYQSTGYGRVGPRTQRALAVGCNGAVGGGSSSTNPAQVGAFLKVTPVRGPAPMSATIEATVNASGSCEAATYIINFGDGSPTYPVYVPAGRCSPLKQSISHYYQLPGNYTLTLSIGTHKTQVQVQVGEGVSQQVTTFSQCMTTYGSTVAGIAPQRQCRTQQGQVFAESTGSGTTQPGTGTTYARGVPIAVSGTFTTIACNTDPAYNQIVRVNWGDGTIDDIYTHSTGLSSGGCATTLSRSVSHAYQNEGTYTILLQDLRTTTGGSPTLFTSQVLRTVTISGKPGGVVTPTNNRLTITPTYGASPLSVAAQFMIRSGDPYEINWGDGTSPTVSGSFAARQSLPASTIFAQGEQLVTAQHTFNGGGTRTVTLKVGSYELNGSVYEWRTRFYTQQVVITGTPGTTPTTEGDSLTASPATGNAPLTVSFSVTINGAKSCNDGIYSIDFGDGQYTSLPYPADLCDVQKFVVTHQYQSGGSFAAKLYAGPQSSISGLTPVQTADIIVSGTPPSNAEVITNYAVTPGVGGDPRKVEARFTLKDACTGFVLNWGDGASDSASATGSCNTTGIEIVKQHTYTTNGTFNIQVTATNNGTQTARTATISISS